jgi:hypothetical protein
MQLIKNNDSYFDYIVHIDFLVKKSKWYILYSWSYYSHMVRLVEIYENSRGHDEWAKQKQNWDKESFITKILIQKKKYDNTNKYNNLTTKKTNSFLFVTINSCGVFFRNNFFKLSIFLKNK